MSLSIGIVRKSALAFRDAVTAFGRAWVATCLGSDMPKKQHYLLDHRRSMASTAIETAARRPKSTRCRPSAPRLTTAPRKSCHVASLQIAVEIRAGGDQKSDGKHSRNDAGN